MFSSPRTTQSDIASTDVLSWWWCSLQTSRQPECSGQHLEMEKIWRWEWAIPRGPPRGFTSLLRWCYQWQLREGGARFEPLRQPRASRPSADTHLLHMSILPLNPSKGFPESSSPYSGPQLFEVLILCFHGTEVITLWPCHVKRLIQTLEVLQGTLNVTIGHKPAY